MNPALILVDGMVIAHRSAVAKAIFSKFERATPTELYTCDIDTPLHLYVHMMKDVLEKRKTVIIDNGWRAHQILEGMGQPTSAIKEFRRMLDRIALGCDAQIALCTASEQSYISRTPNFEEQRVAISQMHVAWVTADTHGLQQIRISTSDDYSDDIENLLDRVLIHSGRNIGPGIGNWNPGRVVLLIGDRHGPSIQPYSTQFNLAFCDMAKAGSSFWLTKLLEEAGIQERHLYWINAYDKEDIPTDPGFIGRLEPVAILSMGDSAERWCKSNALKSEPFSHPQYHKRFQYKEPYPLISRLVEAVEELD